MPTVTVPIAERVCDIQESVTTRITAKARLLRLQGRRVIDLSVGEPRFETPPPIIAATCRALVNNATRYGPTAGEPELRSRLAALFEDSGPDNILITNGAKQALYALFQVLCGPGDEIILPRPCWVSFPEQIKLAGGAPVLVGTVNHHPEPEAIAAAITPRTRAILINSPNNPTGAVYSERVMTGIARIASEAGVFLIADEAYHAFTFDGTPHIGLFNVSETRSKVITVRSFSKHYNMTGFRLGYVAADTTVIHALVKLQSHLCGNVCTFAQHGAIAALDMDQHVIEERINHLERLRDIAHAHAEKLFPCPKPMGAFYLFADIRDRLSASQTSADLAQVLLEQTGVAVVPGEAFGAPGHIRISFAVAEKDLRDAFEKINGFLNRQYSGVQTTTI